MLVQNTHELLTAIITSKVGLLPRAGLGFLSVVDALDGVLVVEDIV